MLEIIDSSKFEIPRSIAIFNGAIVITQILISSLITYNLTRFSTPNYLNPFLYFAKPVFSIALFILAFAFIQAITNRIILTLMHESLKRHFLLSTIYITTYYIIPLIPFHEIINPILKISGAKIGRGVVITMGTRITEPHLVEIGDKTQIGGYALIAGHTTEKQATIFKKIVIGSNVLIGSKSFVQPGVVVGNNSIIAAGAVVTKNTRIPENTVWGGVPAKKIKDA